MSDYVDHPFFNNMEKLKEILEGFDSSSLDAQNSENFMRFKKVIVFIDTLLENSDPDLVPKSVLDNANSNLSNCLSNINSFVSNKNISYLNQANKYIDNVLTSLKPYSLYDKKLRRSLREAINVYINEINSHLENIANTEDELLHAKELKSNIEEYYNELFTDKDADSESIQSKINKLFQKTEEQYNEINSFYNETLIDEDGKPSTKTEVQTAKLEILQDLNEARKRMVEVSTKIDDLDKLYIKIFGSEDAEGNRQGGLAEEINKKINDLDTYEKAQKKIHKQLHNDIENLLSGAVNTGLANAYQERRKSYKGPLIWWDFVFLSSLAGMFVGGYLTLKDFKDITETIKHLLEYAPLYIPTIWLAFYASKRRSESRAFEEEYAHKEALAKSFSSYKKQIEELGKANDELMEKLLSQTIDTISDNPTSRVLERKHGDNLPIIEMLKELKEKGSKK